MSTDTPSLDIRERVWTDDHTHGAFDTFVFEPSNADGRALGTLFLVGAFLFPKKTTEQQAFLLNTIAALARRSFFAPGGGASASLEALEYTLRQVNALLGRNAEEGKLDWVGNLHLVIGCLSGNDIHLARAGSADLLLLRKGSIQNVGSMFEEPEEKPSSFKVFSAIASGALEEDDILFLASPADPRRIPALRAITKDLGGDLFDALHAENSLLSYAAIVLDARAQRATNPSSFVERLERAFTEAPHAVARSLSLEEAVSDPTPTPSSAPATVRDGLFAGASSLLRRGRDLGASVASSGTPLRATGPLMQKTKRVAHISLRLLWELVPSVSQRAHRAIRWFRSLRYPIQHAASGGIAGVMLLLVITLTISPQSPSGPSVPPTPVAALASALSAASTPLQTVLPRRVADLTTNPFGFEANGVAATARGQVLFGGKSGSLYRIDPGGSAQFVLFAATNGFRDSAASADGNRAFLLTHDGAVMEYDPAGSAGKTRRLPLSYDAGTVVDIAEFGDAFYLLRADGAIYKYSEQQGVITETLWAAATLPSPAAIAVDGSIFVLSAEGTIGEFHRGSLIRTIETNTAVTGSTDAAAKRTLWASPDAPMLIIAIPSLSSAISIDKQTLERRAVRAEGIGEAQSAAVDPSGTTLYLLAGTSVYAVDIKN